MLKHFFHFLFVFLVISPITSWAAPAYHPSRTQNTNSIPDVVGDLQHEVGNHEAELRMFEERLVTQENILDSLRQQFMDTHVAQQELVKGSSQSLETRMSGVESKLDRLISDVKELQKHFNDSVKVITQHRQKISEMEKQIGNLQAAVSSVGDALQLDLTKTEDRVYVVKSRDTLGKIAEMHNTSIKKIKETNGLKNDRIVVGQKIKIP